MKQKVHLFSKEVNKTLKLAIMENTTENKEMTAQESLSLITETLNNSRRDITRRSGKYFLFWGVLLVFFSLLVYLLWKITGHPEWNCLWFAMPAVGIPLERFMHCRNGAERVQNDVSRINGGIWAVFGCFACAVSAFTLIFCQLNNGLIANLAIAFNLTPEIALLFGLAECVSGVTLKNWVIKIAGFVTGIGGLALYYITGAEKEQMFIFAFSGLVLVVTGLLVKYQYR